MTKIIRIPLIFAFTLMLILPIRAEINYLGKDAPPEISSQAHSFVSKRDFAGIDGMVAKIDSAFGKNHGSDYFRGLNGVLGAFSRSGDPTKIDFNELWAQRKLLWKILLTPYSNIEDGPEIQDLKDNLSSFAVPIPFFSFARDQNQFFALRRDAAALLTSYGQTLRAPIIPGYQIKPEYYIQGARDLLPDPTASAKAAADEKRLEPVLKQNALQNAEQTALSESLENLGSSVELLAGC